MDDYLSKPFEPRALHALIQKYHRVICNPLATSDESASQPSCGQSLTTGSPIFPIPAEPPIAAAVLLDRCLGDLEFMDSLLDELTITGPRRVAEIASCAEQDDSLETANAAHALKGAAAVLGAGPVLRLTTTIEDRCREGTLDEIPAMIEDLKREMNRCIEFIPTVRTSASQLKTDDIITRMSK